MNYPSATIEKAVEQLSRFPGIGKKSALRMTLFLLRSSEEVGDEMAKAIVELQKNTKFCTICGNISDQEECSICRSVNRNQEVICVVKDFQDVIALENTGQYSGLYHVLGGLISPMQGIGPSDIRIDSLIKRVEERNAKEIIMALSASMEGDTTAFYIGKRLKDLQVNISSIARGISVGGELEYADEITLGRSIRNRVPYGKEQ
jgi:recombination protein RecR